MSEGSSAPLKVAIVGTRGIPNRYGGFEQFAEYLAVGLYERGHEVGVYLPDFHDYQEDTFKGVQLHRIGSPEKHIGAAANFLYDYFSLRDAIRRGYEIVLECGYGTSAPSLALTHLGRCIVVTNMDGLEWRRAKWSRPVQRLTRWFEAMAVRNSHALVSDNVGIQDYLKEAYGAESTYIPYGADIVLNPSADVLAPFDVVPGAYQLAVARLEPENNLEMICDGHRASGCGMPLLVIGNDRTAYGGFLRNCYQDVPSIHFLGAIYEKRTLDALRHHARIYFHGHSVGGTNPSLLEAMGCGAFIAAHDNSFNRTVVGEGALYFAGPGDVAGILAADLGGLQGYRGANIARIREEFNWDFIIESYERLFLDLVARRRPTVP